MWSSGTSSDTLSELYHDPTCFVFSELLSNVAVEGEEDSTEAEDTPSISMTTTSTAYSLIETAHPVFWPVKKLWNSHVDTHREVGVDMLILG